MPIAAQADSAENPHIRMHSMGARDTSMNFEGGGSAADHIQATEVDGFEVGSDNDVNQLTTTYHWIAFARDGTQTVATPRLIRWDARDWTGTRRADRTIEADQHHPCSFATRLRNRRIPPRI